mmetsp:Transcript_76373/g.184813  ORF Transcript_76373/g.184813 Transcript_76373/m.184813 type:complete len:100 (-) Transcript_76373:1695-1994(-)
MCLPSSATCPSLSTKMTSEFWMVLRRCAMQTMVMPRSDRLAILSIVSWIIFSEELSRALVASSRKSMEGFLMSARARAIRCFWPPENALPLVPTYVRNA